MRVGVDATSWANRRGYGRFARNVVSRLVAAEKDNYVLFADAQTAREEQLPGRAEVRTVALSRPAVEAAAADSQRPLRDLARLSRAASREPLDVFLFPSVFTWFPVFRTPTVVGIHDVIADQYPELTLPSRAARSRWRLKQGLAARRAARIFSVSHASRAAVAGRLGMAEEDIGVVPEAPDPVFGPRAGSQIANALTPLGLAAGSRYLLYAGGISPHKGISTLVDAYTQLADDSAPLLMLVGALEEETYMSAAGALRRQVEDLGLRDRVFLTGHVSDETLACLYAGAVAFVSPSLSEGFGLPAVEAACSETAVVLSDIPAHRETLGDAALYFPAGDASALAEQLARMVDDEALRARLAAAGRKQVSGLSWDTSSSALRSILADAAHG